jgi:hypothetical protein
LTTVCRLWPGISPHGPDVPTSVWNLPYGVWLGFADYTDQYLKAQKEAAK